MTKRRPRTPLQTIQAFRDRPDTLRAAIEAAQAKHASNLALWSSAWACGFDGYVYCGEPYNDSEGWKIGRSVRPSQRFPELYQYGVKRFAAVIACEHHHLVERALHTLFHPRKAPWGREQFYLTAADREWLQSLDRLHGMRIVYFLSA